MERIIIPNLSHVDTHRWEFFFWCSRARSWMVTGTRMYTWRFQWTQVPMKIVYIYSVRAHRWTREAVACGQVWKENPSGKVRSINGRIVRRKAALFRHSFGSISQTTSKQREIYGVLWTFIILERRE